MLVEGSPLNAHDARTQMARARHSAYTGGRSDLVSLLPSLRGPVLDVGCSTGAIGQQIQEAHRVPVTGIELDPSYAAQASTVLEDCIQADAVEGIDQLRTAGRSFSAVVLADILEHLQDPWAAFDRAASLVVPGGWMLVSIPNVGHWSTHASLLSGRWPRRSRGIHDVTHLRFFARRDLQELMNRRPARLVAYRRVYRLLERPHPVNRFASRVAWVAPDLFTYQFYLLSQVAGPHGSARQRRIGPWSGTGSVDW